MSAVSYFAPLPPSSRAASIPLPCSRLVPGLAGGGGALQSLRREEAEQRRLLKPQSSVLGGGATSVLQVSANAAPGASAAAGIRMISLCVEVNACSAFMFLLRFKFGFFITSKCVRLGDTRLTFPIATWGVGSEGSLSCFLQNFLQNKTLACFNC